MFNLNYQEAFALLGMKIADNDVSRTEVTHLVMGQGECLLNGKAKLPVNKLREQLPALINAARMQQIPIRHRKYPRKGRAE